MRCSCRQIAEALRGNGQLDHHARPDPLAYPLGYNRVQLIYVAMLDFDCESKPLICVVRPSIFTPNNQVISITISEVGVLPHRKRCPLETRFISGIRSRLQLAIISACHIGHRTIILCATPEMLDYVV